MFIRIGYLRVRTCFGNAENLAVEWAQCGPVARKRSVDTIVFENGELVPLRNFSSRLELAPAAQPNDVDHDDGENEFHI